MSDRKKLEDMLKTADMERLNMFMKTFERLLVYSMAKMIMSKEDFGSIVNFWNFLTKKGIDVDATSRTRFLQSTHEGRLAAEKDEPDGEELRLYLLSQLNIATYLINSSFNQNFSGDNPDEHASGSL